MPAESKPRYDRLVTYGSLAGGGAPVLFLACLWIWLQSSGASQGIPTTGLILLLLCVVVPGTPSSFRRTCFYLGAVAVVFGPNIVAAVTYEPVDENNSAIPALAATVVTILQCLLAVSCFILAHLWARRWPTCVSTCAPHESFKPENSGRSSGSYPRDSLRVAPLMFAGLFVSTAVQHLVLAALDTELAPSQHYVTVHGWLGNVIGGATAGFKEEPIFVGIAVALWPVLNRRTLLGLITLTTVARTTIHLYYAHGPVVEHIDTIAGVALWCAIWSGLNLMIVYYRPTLLWAVAIGHGLYNIALHLRDAPDALPAQPVYQAIGSLLYWTLGIAGPLAAGRMLTPIVAGSTIATHLHQALPFQRADPHQSSAENRT